MNPVLLHSASMAREVMGGAVHPAQLPDLAARAGFAGVEWLDRLMPSYRPQDWHELGRAQEVAGCTAAALSLGLEVAAPPALVAEQVDRMKRLIGMGPMLGVSAVRVMPGGGSGLSVSRMILALERLAGAKAREERPLSGPARALYRWSLGPAGGPRPEPAPADPGRLQSLAWALEPLARQAGGLGMVLGLENHPGLVHRPEDAAQVVALAGQAGQGEHEHGDAGWALRGAGALGPGVLGICLDTGNLPQGYSPSEAARLLAPLAVHVHWKLRSNPPQATEREGLAAMARELQAAGYAGLISVEYDGPGDPMAGAARARELWLELAG